MKFERKILNDRIAFDEDGDYDYTATGEFLETHHDEFLALETVVWAAIETINSDYDVLEKYDYSWTKYVDETAWDKTRHLFKSDVTFSMAYNYIMDEVDEKLSNPLHA